MEAKNHQNQGSFKTYDDEGNELWEVEQILDKKYDPAERRNKYRVKWKGWGESESTWEPIENLLAVQDLIDEFENGLKTKKKISKPNKSNDITSNELSNIEIDGMNEEKLGNEDEDFAFISKDNSYFKQNAKNKDFIQDKGYPLGQDYSIPIHKKSRSNKEEEEKNVDPRFKAKDVVNIGNIDVFEKSPQVNSERNTIKANSYVPENQTYPKNISTENGRIQLAREVDDKNKKSESQSSKTNKLNGTEVIDDMSRIKIENNQRERNMIDLGPFLSAKRSILVEEKKNLRDSTTAELPIIVSTMNKESAHFGEMNSEPWGTQTSKNSKFLTFQSPPLNHWQHQQSTTLDSFPGLSATNLMKPFPVFSSDFEEAMSNPKGFISEVRKNTRGEINSLAKIREEANKKNEINRSGGKSEIIIDDEEEGRSHKDKQRSQVKLKPGVSPPRLPINLTKNKKEVGNKSKEDLKYREREHTRDKLYEIDSQEDKVLRKQKEVNKEMNLDMTKPKDKQNLNRTIVKEENPNELQSHLAKDPHPLNTDLKIKHEKGEGDINERNIKIEAAKLERKRTVLKKTLYCKNSIKKSVNLDGKVYYQSVVNDFMNKRLTRHDFLELLCPEGNFKDDEMEYIKCISWEGKATTNPDDYYFKVVWKPRKNGVQKACRYVSWQELEEERPEEAAEFIFQKLVTIISKYGTFGEF